MHYTILTTKKVLVYLDQIPVDVYVEREWNVVKLMHSFFTYF